MAGLQKYAGTIQVQTGLAEERPQLGMVFQNPDLQLFNATVREEVLYRLPKPDLKLYDWLMGELMLERYASTPPLLLSEGEKRRVALATMLMHKPAHGLLLDEPALGQDAFHKTTLLKLLRAYAGAGFLVVFATHDLELAFQADHLVLLGGSGIAAQGKAPEIMRMDHAWQSLGLVVPEWMKDKCSV
jgi:cobalt/nickel transport system ATP-binding protein